MATTRDVTDDGAPADAWHEDEAVITPYPDGPLIVRGSFRIVDTDGQEIDPGRDTVALCRCGRSAIKPFCDGSHTRVGFRTGGGSRRGGVADTGRGDADRGRPALRTADEAPRPG